METEKKKGRTRRNDRELYAFNWKFSTRTIFILCSNQTIFRYVCIRFSHTTANVHIVVHKYAHIANEWNMCVDETWIVYCINKQYLTMENDKWSNRKVRCYIAYFNKHKIQSEASETERQTHNEPVISTANSIRTNAATNFTTDISMHLAQNWLHSKFIAYSAQNVWYAFNAISNKISSCLNSKYTH